LFSPIGFIISNFLAKINIFWKIVIIFLLKSKKGDDILIIDAFVFDKFRVKSKFFCVFVFLKCAAGRSADTHQNVLNLSETH